VGVGVGVGEGAGVGEGEGVGLDDVGSGVGVGVGVGEGAGVGEGEGVGLAWTQAEPSILEEFEGTIPVGQVMQLSAPQVEPAVF